MQWLADIPQEIRLMIYHEIYNDLRVFPIGYVRGPSTADNDRHAGFTLFLANKQVYAEAKPIFQKDAIFVFKYCHRSERPITKHSQRCLVEFKQDDVRHMRKICCHVSVLVSLIIKILAEKCKYVRDRSELCAPLSEIHLDEVELFKDREEATPCMTEESLVDVGYILSKLKGFRIYCRWLDIVGVLFHWFKPWWIANRLHSGSSTNLLSTRTTML